MVSNGRSISTPSELHRGKNDGLLIIKKERENSYSEGRETGRHRPIPDKDRIFCMELSSLGPRMMMMEKKKEKKRKVNAGLVSPSPPNSIPAGTIYDP